MDRKIAGFHQDEESFWVAELECGHNQHVRHRPPMTIRHWVNHEKGRNKRLGTLLACKACDSESSSGICQETSPPFSQDPE
ncbi:MAG: DUF3565 domain-containing protein [Nitrospinaceae bacterium]|nr:DUF3565 domain-containing protein [Nitrospinaceae bacterium]